MRTTTLLGAVALYASAATATISWTLAKSSSPSADETDAYAQIEAAMELAAARYNELSTRAEKSINVAYAPGVPTAEANYNGDLRFGSDRAYMTERTALHEIAHTLGVGQTAAFDELCAAGDWPTAGPLLESFDGEGAVISCGGGHFWPYGLNYEDEMSDTNADRHVQMVDAMLADGM
ncbi:hypothetical protein F4780DRAFT_780081 [Xylariomycetidae sp. FL0641]|nr:hypothetical protein F4780DRAFT_780081 [Xylariomycetidae sp. FL0641]